MRQALSDILVVEFGGGVAPSWCGKVFADLGADVVKVEPAGGDRLRRQRGTFANINTNKRSLVLDQAAAPSPELLGLLGEADLVVEAPGYGRSRTGASTGTASCRAIVACRPSPSPDSGRPDPTPVTPGPT